MNPPYNTKGYSQYGASMGRRNINTSNYQGERLHLRRVPIDSQGYDTGGAYWGLGSPLWCAYCPIYDGNDVLVFYTRAVNRNAARAIVELEVGNVSVKFFR